MFLIVDLSKVAKRQCRIQNSHSSPGFPSSCMELPTDENDLFYCRKKNKILFQKLQNDTSEFEEQGNKIEFVDQIYYSFRSADGSPSKYISSVHPHTDRLWMPDDNLFDKKNSFLENELRVPRSSSDHLEDKILGSTWRNESLNVDDDTGDRFNALSYNSNEFRNRVEEGSRNFKKTTLHSCSLRSSLLSTWESDKFEFQIDGLRTKQRQICPYQDFDFFPSAKWQEEASSDWSSSRLMKKTETHTDLDFLSRDPLKSLLTYKECFPVEKNLLHDSVEQSRNFGSAHLSLNSESCSMASESLCQTTSWNAGNFTRENAFKTELRFCRNASYEHSVDCESEDWILHNGIRPGCSSQENCSSSTCIDTGLDLKDCAVSSRDIYRPFKGYNLDNVFTPRHSDIQSNETDWIYSKFFGKESNNNCAMPSCSIPISTCIHRDENKERHRYQNCRQIHLSIERLRSHSAPPIFRGKRKFLALTDHWTTESSKVDEIDVHDAPSFPGSAFDMLLSNAYGAF